MSERQSGSGGDIVVVGVSGQGLPVLKSSTHESDFWVILIITVPPSDSFDRSQ